MISRTREITWDYLYKHLRYVAHLLLFWLALVYSKRLKTVYFVGITGSAGKTTVKNLSASIFSSVGKCYSTPGSLNYPNGIAQILLRVSPRHKYCVLEVSGGNPGSLDRPLRLFTPNIAVLTLIGRDHFKAFKSLESIAREKGKLVSALPADGVAVLNIDDPLVRSIGESCNRKVIWVGEAKGANLRLLSTRSRWPEPLVLKVEYNGKVYEVKTALHGKHLALSVLSALGVGLAAGIPLTNAISSVAAVKPAEGRMEIVPTENGVTFLRDDWKAPHWSFSAPLEFMAEAKARRKILIIGTLSDYSLSASKLYPKVAKQALEVGDIVIFVGPHAQRATKVRPNSDIQDLHAFSAIREAAAFLKNLLEPGDLVLLKGSNKADHLVRLMYDTQSPVGCWLNRCGVQDFCGYCPRLYKPMPTGAESIVGEGNILKAGTTPLTGTNLEQKVIVGLGNPGSKYDNTPHNAGFRVLDRIATSAGASWVSYPEGLTCELDIAGKNNVSLFKPAARINNSGPPTRQFLDRINGALTNCLIVHDELDLPLGKVKLKQGGGDSGHNGLKSIIAALGSNEFKRLRVGVKRAKDAIITKPSVLRSFSRSDEEALELGIDQAVSILLREITNSDAPTSNLACSDLKNDDTGRSRTIKK